MGVFSKEVTTMNDLFIQGLGSMYYAEQRILQGSDADGWKDHEFRAQICVRKSSC
jgi:ferritin-like metal-binding protein YciE